MTGPHNPHGVQTPNPVRRPDILTRVKAFVEADPRAATGRAIIALVMSEFQIAITRNQIAGAFLREGITRGGYSKARKEGQGHGGGRRSNICLNPTEGHSLEDTEAKIAAEQLARDRAVIAEQERVIKASIIARPRALTVAPRERPSRAIRMPEVTLASVYNAPVMPGPSSTPRLGRITECCWPIGTPGTKGFRYCDDPHRNRVYCDTHERDAYTHKRQEDAA